MHGAIGRQRHSSKADLIDGFVEDGLLFSFGERAYLGEIEVRPGLLYVTSYEPVRGDDLIEPRELCFVGMATVAGVLEDGFDLRRRGEVCSDWRIGEPGPDELEREEDEEAASDEPEQGWDARAGFCGHEISPGPVCY